MTGTAGTSEMKKQFKEKLKKAIDANDEAGVRDVLSQHRFGYILEEDPLDNHMILLQAIQNENQTIIQVLLDYGADLQAPLFPPVQGKLSFAVQMTSKPAEMLEFLLNNGINVNEMASDGCTALHMASCIETLRDVKILLERGANVNIKNSMGLTALHGASGHGSKDIVEVLLNNGANLNARDEKGKTPLIYAAGGGLEAINRVVKFEFVCADCPGNKCSCFSCTRAKEGNSKYIPANRVSAHEETIAFLLQRGANVQDKDRAGNTVLHYAIRSGRESIIDLLWAHGARVCDNNILDGKNLLTYAAENKLIRIAKILLDNGANPNQATVDNYTPLHAAALCGCNEIIELLLDKGANVDSVGSLKVEKSEISGFTPLHCAVFQDHRSTANLLLSRGANITLAESTGNSVLHVAVARGCTEMIKLLINWGIDVNVKNRYLRITPLYAVAVHKGEDITELLLDRGANLSLGSEAVIVTAMEYGSSENAKFLVKEIVKSISLGLFISDDTIHYISTMDQLSSVKAKCEKEIEELKKKMFSGTKTSYFSVFEKGPAELALLAANENVIRVINSDDILAKEFPFYASSIVKCVLKGVVRKEMMDRLAGFFYNLYKDEDLNEPLPGLPDQCVIKIFDLLSNDDLKNLISEYKCSRRILTVDVY